MSLILQIDTATEYASICLSKNGIPLFSTESADQKNHGAFLQPAIQEMMHQSNYQLTDLAAILPNTPAFEVWVLTTLGFSILIIFDCLILKICL